MKAIASEIRLSFYLETNTGKPYLPTDKQIEEILKLQHMEECTIMPAHGYFAIMRMPMEQYSEFTVEETKIQIQIICKHSRGQ